MANHKCGMLHIVLISSLYMLFKNDIGEIINFQCTKLPSELFRQQWGSYLRNTWFGLNYLIWYTRGPDARSVQRACMPSLCWVL